MNCKSVTILWTYSTKYPIVISDMLIFDYSLFNNQAVRMCKYCLHDVEGPQHDASVLRRFLRWCELDRSVILWQKHEPKWNERSIFWVCECKQSSNHFRKKIREPQSNRFHDTSNTVKGGQCVRTGSSNYLWMNDRPQPTQPCHSCPLK